MEKKNMGGPPNRDEMKALHLKEISDVINVSQELYNHSLFSHEGDIPDEVERRQQARDEMLAGAMLLTSDHYHLEATGTNPPDQPQKKDPSKWNRRLPTVPLSSDEDISLDDFRNPSDDK